MLGDTKVRLTPNENGNNLHSGPNNFQTRMWQLVFHKEDSVKLKLVSPKGDQGFPGKADIYVTYALKGDNGLHIIYDAVADQDTVFNLTNHSYFNLAGHQNTDKALSRS